ncbi:hypothetical protein [Larkinella soli]|uniref:hypothetical protein n=1 Tax=Larkinella soli TaxID=1770527 RepID=UPI000FFB1A93|nr:hypothetical protein [Larkinella soli]
MLKQLFISLANRVQGRVTRFGMKEWVVVVYFFLQPLIWQKCVDGYDYAWNLLQAASLFASADIAEHFIGAYQSQIEMKQVMTRLREWGLVITAFAFLILLVKGIMVGL